MKEGTIQIEFTPVEVVALCAVAYKHLGNGVASNLLRLIPDELDEEIRKAVQDDLISTTPSVDLGGTTYRKIRDAARSVSIQPTFVFTEYAR